MGKKSCGGGCCEKIITDHNRTPDGKEPVRMLLNARMDSRKKSGKNYLSENFSTTRTLSPRTVIGIGTTLS
jgi:hypothetical protein